MARKLKNLLGTLAISGLTLLTACNPSNSNKDTIEIKVSETKDSMAYCGMLNSNIFSLTRDRWQGVNLYYSANSTNINSYEKNLKIIEVNPEKIRFRVIE